MANKCGPLVVLFLATGCGDGWRGVSSTTTFDRNPRNDLHSKSPVAPLDVDTLTFLRAVAQDADEIHRLNVVTGETARISEVRDTSRRTVRSLALSPDRTTIAFSSMLGFDPTLVQEQGVPTEAIWTVAVDGTRTHQIMAPLPDGTQKVACADDSRCEPLGMTCDEAIGRCRHSLRSRSISDLSWSADGQTVWFANADHHWREGKLEGGTTLASITAKGGAPSFPAGNGGCAQVTAPAPSPDGAALVAVRSVCTQTETELVRFSVPLGSSETLVSESDVDFSIALSGVEWLSDGGGVVFGAYGGPFESDAVLYYELASRQLYQIFDAGPGRAIEAFDVSPEGTKLALCLTTKDADDNPRRDLFVWDLSGDTPTLVPLTSDGRSCYPSW